MKLEDLGGRLAAYGKPILTGGVILLGLGLLGVLLAWFAGVLEDKIPPGQHAAPVRSAEGWPTDEVREVAKDYFEESIGTLKAANRTVIASKILATVEEVTVNAGDQVEKGQLLARLSSDELQARLRQAEQAYAAADANRIAAETAYKRLAQLQKTNPGAVTQATIDESVARVRVTRADQSRLRQAVTEAKVLLSYTQIVARRDGRVVDRLAEPGDTIGPGQPLLVVYDEKSLRLEAPVVEHLAIGLTVGQPLTVRIDALNRTVSAVVDEKVPQADAPSRSFLVKVSLPQSDDMYEGMFGRLLIPSGRRHHLCVASDAIRTIGQLQFVDVVRDDGTLERRLIKTGRPGEAGRVEVLSGVDAEETVVLCSRSGETAGDECEVPLELEPVDETPDDERPTDDRNAMEGGNDEP